MSSTIRLTKTKQLERILNEIQERYFPLLDDAEIIKMIVSDYYSALKHRPTSVRRATKQEEEAIEAGRKAILKGDYVTIRANEPIDLDSLC